MDARRKIMFYLNPETNIADSIVNETLDSIPQGERGRLNRAALIAGIALYRQDARIPFLISELLNKDTQFNDIVQLLKSVYPLEMAKLMASTQTDKDKATSSTAAEQHDEQDTTKANAQSLLS
ncbi:plasmid partitioning/stability family protein [Enterobacter hormaechei]